jgi:hypothetical protein
MYIVKVDVGLNYHDRRVLHGNSRHQGRESVRVI